MRYDTGFYTPEECVKKLVDPTPASDSSLLPLVYGPAEVFDLLLQVPLDQDLIPYGLADDLLTTNHFPKLGLQLLMLFLVVILLHLELLDLFLQSHHFCNVLIVSLEVVVVEHRMPGLVFARFEVVEVHLFRKALVARLLKLIR